MSLHHEIKELTPRCRVCGAEPNEVEAFILDAALHNDDPMNAMKVTPQTVCYSGNNYDPSTNSFLCPPCKRKREDEGQEDMYAADTDNQ